VFEQESEKDEMRFARRLKIYRDREYCTTNNLRDETNEMMTRQIAHAAICLLLEFFFFFFFFFLPF
jgi:hypothetical protein